MRLMTAMTAVAALALALTGCQWHRSPAPALSGYETLPKDPHRDTEAARRHYEHGVPLLKAGQLDQAEKAFQDALAADLFFGPAHNNLGTVYLRRQKYYLAAWEFQYAQKLMPHQAEPRNNLGLVYEAVGKLDEAARSYEQALELEPENPRIAGNLARAYVRSNRNDDKTRKLLEAVVMKDDRPDWIAWARERLALMGKPRPAATAPTSMPALNEPSTIGPGDAPANDRAG